MFRLYKRDENGAIVAYHEAWIDSRSNRLIEHWGALGTRGEAKTKRVKILKSLETQFDDILDPAYARGYDQLEDWEQYRLTIEYGVGELADPDVLMDLLVELLGWTGLGFCHYPELTDKAVLVDCLVVDTELAKQVITEALASTQFNTYSRIFAE